MTENKISFSSKQKDQINYIIDIWEQELSHKFSIKPEFYSLLFLECDGDDNVRNFLKTKYEKRFNKIEIKEEKHGTYKVWYFRMYPK